MIRHAGVTEQTTPSKKLSSHCIPSLTTVLLSCAWQTAVPCLTKIVGTVGGNSRSTEELANLLEAGMTGESRDIYCKTGYCCRLVLDSVR